MGGVDSRGKTTALKLTMDLRYNSARVNGKYDMWFWRHVDDYEWFDFFGTTRARTEPSTSTYFSASMRVARMKRDVVVKYQTLQQVISEISGSFTICLVFGGFVTVWLEFMSSKFSGEDSRKEAEAERYPPEVR